MKDSRVGINTILIVIIIIAFACSKEFENKPVFSLKQGHGYLTNDTDIHIMDEVKLGIVVEAIGEGNKIDQFIFEKDKEVLLDTHLNKQRVFFEFNILFDTLDSIDYVFNAYDLNYNHSIYTVNTYYYMDSSDLYISFDSLNNTIDTTNYHILSVNDIDTITDNSDSLYILFNSKNEIIDTIAYDTSLIYRIDTLHKEFIDTLIHINI